MQRGQAEVCGARRERGGSSQVREAQASDGHRYAAALRRFGGPECRPKDLTPILLANVAAFEFWRTQWVGNLLQRRFINGPGAAAGGLPVAAAGGWESVEEAERVWCAAHDLTPLALHAIQEMVDSILEVRLLAAATRSLFLPLSTPQGLCPFRFNPPSLYPWTCPRLAPSPPCLLNISSLSGPLAVPPPSLHQTARLTSRPTPRARPHASSVEPPLRLTCRPSATPHL